MIKTIRQYFKPHQSCTASDSDDPHCNCWHDIGTGPEPERTEKSHPNLPWRDKPGTEELAPETDGKHYKSLPFNHPCICCYTDSTTTPQISIRSMAAAAKVAAATYWDHMINAKTNPLHPGIASAMVALAESNPGEFLDSTFDLLQTEKFGEAGARYTITPMDAEDLRNIPSKQDHSHLDSLQQYPWHFSDGGDPDDANEERRGWAAGAVAHHAEQTRSSDEEATTKVQDLLTNLMHLTGDKFPGLLFAAAEHFHAETSEEE